MTAETTTRPTPAELAGKTIDCHTHAGVGLRMYIRGEFPYAQTVEALHAQQLTGGVDVTVVFPFSGDLYYDPAGLAEGHCRPAEAPLSPVPYESENCLLLDEVTRFAAVEPGRFLPFVSADPARCIEPQCRSLETLLASYPVAGIKINPTGCEAPVSALLEQGKPLLDLTEAHDLPMIVHATTIPFDAYSQAEDIFAIAEARPKLRICLAHALHFDTAALDRAADLPNVWVDTAAMKIQVDFVRDLLGTTLDRANLINADYDDHLDVMRKLCAGWPELILWGTDSPAYTFICKRPQGQAEPVEFSLRGSYAEEVAALRALPSDLQQRVANENTIRFLTGLSP